MVRLKKIIQKLHINKAGWDGRLEIIKGLNLGLQFQEIGKQTELLTWDSPQSGHSNRSISFSVIYSYAFLPMSSNSNNTSSP